MALKKSKVDYLNKEIKNVSREQLMNAIKKADEKNKQIDEKSKISSESLAVRAGTTTELFQIYIDLSN